MKERKRIVWLIGIFVGIFCIRSAAFVPEKYGHLQGDRRAGRGGGAVPDHQRRPASEDGCGPAGLRRPALEHQPGHTSV